MLPERERRFLLRRRVGHLATADGNGMPHVVPACFALGAEALYTPIDEKPKSGRALKRLTNLAANPRASFLADRYDEDWSRLGWVRIDGKAEVIERGAEFNEALRLLAARYPQYAAMRLACVIAIRIAQTRSWGNLNS